MKLNSRLTRSLRRELTYVLVLGTPVVLFFLVAMPRANAVHLLRRAAALRPGISAFAAVPEMAADYASYSVCTADGCTFQFQNRWLHRLHLAPLTQFSVMIRPQGLLVASVAMALYVAGDPPPGDPAPDPIASALVFDSIPSTSTSAYQTTITTAPDGRALQTVVVLTPGATAGQRNRAHAFNLGCLTKIGGCKTSRDALPTVWQQARHVYR